jgi:GNAT superfamily N-acetyltransferase
MEIKQITYEECLVLWKMLWVNRVSPIEPTSSMVFYPSCKGRIYSQNIGTPIFLGAFIDGILVGVNSLHSLDDTTRSRGLYVLGEHRGKGIANALLKATIDHAESFVWSYPKEEALSVYEKAGFKIASEIIHDVIENKWNYYVRT